MIEDRHPLLPHLMTLLESARRDIVISCPEAIMPLTRSADGRLGVQAQGGGTVNVTMNITTPDVQGFQRSQSQIAAQMSRMMSRGQRNR